jgi:hypothetical protein
MPGANPQSDTPQRGPAWLSRLPPWFLLVGLLFFLLWMPAAFINLFVDGNYLPSVDWLEASRPYVYLLWAISVGANFLCGLIGTKSTGANAYIDAIFITAVAFGLTFIPLSNVVYSGVPSLIAAVAGDKVQHQFRVSANNLPGYKWCRNPLDLEGMPFMTALCDAKEFRPPLAPGRIVTFGGQGTWMGLYVEYIQR